MRKHISIIAAASIAAMLSGCGDTGSDDSVTVATATNPQETISGTNTVSFTSIPTPTTDAQKLTLQHSETVTINGTVKPIDFSVIMATDTADNGEIFGQAKDQNDQPITFADGSPYICNGTNDGVGSGLDFSSILQKNGKLYMVSQFECQIGAMYKFELNQDTTRSVKCKTGNA